MPELDELYGALADDANRSALSSPQALRRRADRRARTRMLLACATAVVALGVAGTAWGVLREPSAAVDPAQPPSAPASVSASASGAPSAGPSRTAGAKPPTSIPAGAMLKLPAANRSDLADRDTGATTIGAPCGAALPGRDQVVVQRNRETRFHHAGDPGRTSAEVIHQNISVFKAGQAETLMRQLRGAVRSCPSAPVKHGQERYVLVELQGLGDDAFRIDTTGPLFNPALEEVEGEVTSFTTYIRIGSVVTRVEFSGWEGTTTPRAADVRIVTDAAVGPLRQWLTP